MGNNLKAKITIDLDIKLNNAAKEEIEHLLRFAVNHLSNYGFFTGDSPAEVNDWSYDLEINEPSLTIQKTLFSIFDGIINSADSLKNCKSAKDVEDYAENGMNLYIDKKDTIKIFNYIKKYKKIGDDIDNSDTVYKEFEKPLNKRI